MGSYIHIGAMAFIEKLSHLDRIAKESRMQQKNLKKLLAGLGVAGLLGAGGMTLPGAHAAGSG